MNNENQQAENLFEKEKLDRSGKTPYEKPQLIKYGKVKNITKGGNSTFTDEDSSQPLI